MTSTVRTSVLLATRNRPEFLRECLDSLGRCRHEGCEILVLDQSDGRESADVAAAARDGGLPLVHLALDSRGKSKALNAGIARARGRRLALTDDDCVVAEDWLEAMDNAFPDSPDDRRVVVTGRVLPGRSAPDGTPPPSCIEDTTPAEYSGRVGREVVYQNWAVDRAVFEEVGLFDERLGPGGVLRNAEDNDMAYRWLRAGYRVLYRPEVTVWHNGWRDRSGLYALKWDYGVGQGAFYAKHACRGDGHLAWRWARDFLRLSRHTVTSLLRGDPSSSRANAIFLAGLVIGALRMTGRTVRGDPPWREPDPGSGR